MKKIIIEVFSVVIVLVLIGIGYKNYSDTYRGRTAYALVTTVPKKTQTKDRDGKVQRGLYSYQYDFDWVFADGSKQQMSFEISGENPTPLQVGKYVTAEISKRRVTAGPKYTTEDKIPSKVQQELKQSVIYFSEKELKSCSLL